MIICDLCCKEIKNKDDCMFGKDSVETYCKRCYEWNNKNYNISEDEELAKKVINDLRKLMDERRENLEYLKIYIDVELAKRMKRPKT